MSSTSPMTAAGGCSYPRGMTVSVNLPDDLAARLVAEASRRGRDIDDVAAELLEQQLPGVPESSGPRRLSFAAIGESRSSQGAAEADEMLAEGFGRD
jgi:plasmid stability protein